MERNTVQTADAPAAVGAYSQAIVIRHHGLSTLYSSGQIALDVQTGAMVGAGDVRAEAEQVLKNLEAVLAAANMNFGNVVKTTIYLADMNDFSAVNGIYAARFEAAPPARSTVQAAALPRGARVEIDVVAVAEDPA